MHLPLRHPRVWLLIGWAMVALAVIGSLMPVAHLPPAGVNDKIQHSGAYAALALWFAGIYPRSRYAVIAGALFLLGLAIEGAQGVMHVGRHADYRDIAANALGIGVGISLALIWLGGWAQRLEAWVSKS